MATSGSDKMSDEIKSIKCCFCAAENRTREADYYCVQCKDYYCSPCVDNHKKYPGMKEHTLLDKTHFRSLGEDRSLPSFPTQRCAQHPSKVVDMYCKDHDEVSCASCIALSHRTCGNIYSIPEEINNLYNRTTLTERTQEINKTKESLVKSKAAKENHVKVLKEVFAKEVKAVKEFRQELQKLLDTIEQETIKELENEFGKIDSKLTSEIIQLESLIEAVNEVSSLLSKSEGNNAQEFVGIKSFEKVAVKAKDVEKFQREMINTTVCFTADQKIKEFLQQTKVFSKVSSDTQVFKPKDGLYRVKSQRQIEIKLDNDSSTCSVFGSCITDDDLLLLSDYGNKKLKRLDMSTETIKDYLDLPAGPFAICLVNKTEAAVALNNRTVQFVSIGNRLSATHTLTMNHNCYGIAQNDNKLFISDGGKTVYIHAMNGHELKTVSTESDASGKDILKSTNHITVSVTGDKVFIADEGINGVVILDIQGNYLSTLTYTALSGCKGLCTAGRNLFVCGLSSNNIVQIGKDNKLLGQLGKVESPLSLCFDPHKNRLIATLHNNSKITVLELE